MLSGHPGALPGPSRDAPDGLLGRSGVLPGRLGAPPWRVRMRFSLGSGADVSTIFVRFFDENWIDFVERLLDDRRSLDDTFIVSAMMRDVEKTLKNLDRAHKIRVRRRFDYCSPTIASPSLSPRSKDR